MSSKITQLPGGLPHAAPSSKQEPGSKNKVGARAPTRTGPRASVGKNPTSEAHSEEDLLLHTDVKDEGQPHPDGHRGAQADSKGQGLRPAAGLAMPQAGGGVSSLRQRQAGSAQGAQEGRRPEHQVWARLIAQASPERLAQGQAVLGEHKAALEAFAKLVPAVIKPR